MTVIARSTLREFWERPGRGDAEGPLKAWLNEARKATWRDWSDIKQLYRSASPVGGGRVVFNIGGNKYRLVVWINYPAGVVYIKFVGTHREYDRVDVRTIEHRKP